jgi:NCS1 family nucleobase:cation symporter-1
VPVREALKTLVGQGLVEHASSGAAAFSWFIGAIVAFLIHWGLSRSRAATSV